MGDGGGLMVPDWLLWRVAGGQSLPRCCLPHLLKSEPCPAPCPAWGWGPEHPHPAPRTEGIGTGRPQGSAAHRGDSRVTDLLEESPHALS